MVKLVDKKKISHNNEDYIIDVFKKFHTHIDGTDYYEYVVDFYIYNNYTGFKRIFFKPYKCFYEYETYWLDYFNYNGNIDKVINKAFNKYDFNLREQKYINKKEMNF